MYKPLQSDHSLDPINIIARQILDISSICLSDSFSLIKKKDNFSLKVYRTACKCIFLQSFKTRQKSTSPSLNDIWHTQTINFDSLRISRSWLTYLPRASCGVISAKPIGLEPCLIVPVHNNDPALFVQSGFEIRLMDFWLSKSPARA